MDTKKMFEEMFSRSINRTVKKIDESNCNEFNTQIILKIDPENDNKLLVDVWVNYISLPDWEDKKLGHVLNVMDNGTVSMFGLEKKIANAISKIAQEQNIEIENVGIIIFKHKSKQILMLLRDKGQAEVMEGQDNKSNIVCLPGTTNVKILDFDYVFSLF